MIKGNTTALLQARVSTQGELGTKKHEWHDVIELKHGALDLTSGDSKYTSFNAKVQESTHIFICDYVAIPETLDFREAEDLTYPTDYANVPEVESVPVSTENTRLVINSKTYDVLLIDNPMELNKQLEIYLKFTGGR